MSLVADQRRSTFVRRFDAQSEIELAKQVVTSVAKNGGRSDRDYKTE